MSTLLVLPRCIVPAEKKEVLNGAHLVRDIVVAALLLCLLFLRTGILHYYRLRDSRVEMAEHFWFRTAFEVVI
jgi:hypothetical protein